MCVCASSAHGKAESGVHHQAGRDVAGGGWALTLGSSRKGLGHKHTMASAVPRSNTNRVPLSSSPCTPSFPPMLPATCASSPPPALACPCPCPSPRCAEFFMSHGHFGKAVKMYIAAQQYSSALELCVQHDVHITEVGRCMRA